MNDGINFYSEFEAVAIDDLLAQGFELKILNNTTAVHAFVLGIRDKIDGFVQFREHRFRRNNGPFDFTDVAFDRWTFNSGPLEDAIVRVRRAQTEDLFKEIDQEHLWSMVLLPETEAMASRIFPYAYLPLSG